MTNARIGILALVVIGAMTYLGFAKRVPWAQDYELRAVVRQASELHGNSPVRIAGVNVGKVKGVERGPGTTAIVTMAIEDTGRPVHRDATLKIRPRIFLEGNFFVDLSPGTPDAGELGDGDTIPLAQTATPVQLDEVLRTLDADTRAQARSLVSELGETFDRGGAVALRRGYPHWRGAFGGAAALAEDLRGTDEHDLSGAVRAQARVARALAAKRRELAELVVGFDRVAGAVADRDAELAATFRGLASTVRVAHPALGAVNEALPSLRAFTGDVRPLLRRAPRTLDLAIPALRQVEGLVRRREAPGLVRDLRAPVRTLARIQPRLRGLLDLVKPVTDCVERNALPVLNGKLEDGALSTGQPAWQELLSGMVGLASASQNFDGNGPAVRYHGGYGDQLFSTGQVPQVGQLFGLSEEPLIGSRPPWPGPGKQPPFRPDVPCTSQKVADLRAGMTPAPAQRRGRQRDVDLTKAQRLLRRARR